MSNLRNNQLSFKNITSVNELVTKSEELLSLENEIKVIQNVWQNQASMLFLKRACKKYSWKIPLFGAVSHQDQTYSWAKEFY